MDYKFSLFPIERTARSFNRGGYDDDDFDVSLLPFKVTDDVWIEDVSQLIDSKEFDIHQEQLGTYAIERLRNLKYAIIHRFPRTGWDEKAQRIIFNSDQELHSRNLVEEVTACLRLIRPIAQRTQFCGGDVADDGKLINFHFDLPLNFFSPLQNQAHFSIRTSDIENLRLYTPLFRRAMAGQFWKFRMAVEMFQSGYFQQTHWKARFFLWTAALESLFTSEEREHAGSLVAKERIKFLLSPTTRIYPHGELIKFAPENLTTVADVIDEIYCLRNHVAHGDKIPDYYYQPDGRADIEGEHISRVDMLLEATSSVVRQSLLAILKRGLLEHFSDSKCSMNFFSGEGLTKKEIEGSLKSTGGRRYQCPT